MNLFDDRNEKLPSYVATDDDDIGFIELGGGEELFPTLVRSVDIGAEIDSH
jgi:hypothetical protein